MSSSFTLYDYADLLRERGWLVPAYSMPPNREDLVIQRILVRHGFTRDMADELLLEMQDALRALGRTPTRAVIDTRARRRGSKLARPLRPIGNDESYPPGHGIFMPILRVAFN